jgi:hypothetical protein
LEQNTGLSPNGTQWKISSNRTTAQEARHSRELANPNGCEWRQLKITYNAANKWPGNSLLTLNYAFLSSFPVSAVFTCCASLLSLGHASEPTL